MKKIDKIVLHIPHSSTNLSHEGWNVDEKDIDIFNNLVLDRTDLFTDLIFYSEVNADKNVKAIIGEVNRFYCDLERLENDELEKEGQGIIYTKFDRFTKTISDVEKQKIMDEVYYPHIERVKNELTENSLLIDCHSFIDEENTGIDFNLGFNEDWSKPSKETFDYIYNYFSRCGYNIGVNTPYSNSLSPKTNFNYQSIMIEMNKKHYLSENNRELKGDAYKLHYKILRLYKELLQL